MTPFQVWLAVVAMSGISWGTYLLQRYVSPGHGPLFGAILGGLYSSTATTVALARVLRETTGRQPLVEAAILIATTVMYLRIVLLAGLFDTRFALALAPSLLALGAVTGLAAVLLWRRGRGVTPELPAQASNPLRIGTALTFATSHVPQFESSPVTTRFLAEVTGDRIRLTATYDGGMATGFATRVAPSESPER